VTTFSERLLSAAAASALLLPAALLAQRSPATRDPAVARFAAEARAGTTRYRDREAAIADGFRRVGVDFPGMGEHWVSLERIMADSFAAAEPSVLTYASVRGVPTLVGVAYTALLEPGESPPPFAPARSFWHEHNGTVDEESFPLAHHSLAHHSAASHVQGDSPRLAILHAWVWADNPDGLFVADNWSLPLVRLGVPPRTRASAGALAAIALALGAEDFYSLAVRSGAALSAPEEDAMEGVLRRHRLSVERELRGVRERRRLAPDVAHRLDSLWTAMWGEVERVAPARAARIRQVAASPAVSRAPAAPARR